MTALKVEALHENLCFLKLGGSLITDKDTPHTPRPEVIARLAAELATVYASNPGLQIVLGHGSGSFGHVPARKYDTRQGVYSLEDWQGFVEVWREASQLNRLVMDALAEVDLPAVAFPASATVLAENGHVHTWDLQPIQATLHAGLLPVVFGDVVFDRQRGGTILSTEDLFSFLAYHLRPARILLAGREPGVWQDFPHCSQIYKEITPGISETLANRLKGSSSVDVTGGMLSKVTKSLDWVQQLVGVEVIIFSGLEQGNLIKALTGQSFGTRIYNP